MTNRGPSVEAILAAARVVVVHRGPNRFTLSAVASAAGVSRPTLYRWFPTKAHLLAAITDYEVERFDQGLKAEIERHASSNRRLGAALRYLVMYLDDEMGADPVAVDPGFAIQSLRALLDSRTEALARQLGSSLDLVPAVRDGSMSRIGAAEMFQRLAYSHYLVPHPDPDSLLTAMRAFSGLGRLTRSATRSTDLSRTTGARS